MADEMAQTPRAGSGSSASVPHSLAFHRDYVTRENVLNEIKQAFELRDPDYSTKRSQAQGKLDDLGRKLGGTTTSQNPMYCANQILLEATWLVHYGEAWDKITQKLQQLESLIGQPDNAPLEQGADGSWGICSENFFQKLDPTVDALQTKSVRQQALKPLLFLKSFNDPQVVLSNLYSLQITDIAATGHNRRDELGSLIASLSQLIFKDEIRSLLASQDLEFKVTDELEQVYRDFLRQTQHPRTGYWGPWYRFGDRLVMVQDLSFTFHIVSYLGGTVDRWEALIDTTLEIKNLRYPMGWRPREVRPNDRNNYNNHNNYDVVRILAYGWPHMRQDQRRRSRKAIEELLRWCLRHSVKGDGFGPADDSVDGYYYGIRFLDQVGVWDAGNRFWTDESSVLPASESFHKLAVRLRRGFSRVQDVSAESETVGEILDRALRLTAAG